jgi:integrase/recombinase XerD
VAKFYSARSKTIPPLPWQTFALPFSQALARHKNLGTTQRYIDINDNKLRAAVELLS